MKVKLKWVYKGKKTQPLLFESDWTNQESIEAIMDDLINTGRTAELTILDEMGNEWTRKEFKKLNETIELEPHDIVVYFDGGYDIQSERAGIGMVIYYHKGGQSFRMRMNGLLDELESNNEAEYAALYNAILLLEELGVKNMPCTIRGDSLGVLKQMEGEWPCFEENLNSWLDRIEEKITFLNLKPLYEAVPRKDNKEADQLASQALNNKMIQSHASITK